ncbi:hypothetical protein SLA2020_508250 [Shorea laevis]
MERKSTVSVVFLLLLLLATPRISKGSSDALDTEVYQIDYRGPETHSSIPPPDHYGGGRPFIHRQSARGNREGDAKKIHG